MAASVLTKFIFYEKIFILFIRCFVINFIELIHNIIFIKSYVMKKKWFLKGFIVTTLLFYSLVLIIDFIANNDDKHYKSKFPKIDAKTILDTNKDNDFVVIVFSPNCSGVPMSFPILKKDLSFFMKQGVKYYLIADIVFNAIDDKKIKDTIIKYRIPLKNIYVLNKNVYQKNGGIFHSKQRYKDFVYDLCQSNGNGLGYPQYFIFKKGKFYKSSYPLVEGFNSNNFIK